ncbi:LysE family translocator [Streptomyces sp. NPDC056069]|uniref:LysE family translocator n=1 Tax=Streptomyces sp. NPDC056069 TaxID=3345702 RepID=UPI0035D56B30
MPTHLATATGVLALLTVTPGPDMAVVTRRAVVAGARDALRTAGGIATGLLVWGALAAAGLAAVLAASPTAYRIVELLGAGYLVLLGAQALWQARRTAPLSAAGAVAEAVAEAAADTAADTVADATPPAPAGQAAPGTTPAPPAPTGQSAPGTTPGPSAPAPPSAPARSAAPGSAWRTGLVANLLNPKIGVFYTGLLPTLAPPGLPAAWGMGLLVLLHVALTGAWLGSYVLLLAKAGPALRRPGVQRGLGRVTGVVLIGFGLAVATAAG